MHKISLQQIQLSLRYFACWVAFGFGTGFLQGAPGSFATFIIGIPLYLSLATLPSIYYKTILITSIVLGIIVCTIAEQTLQSSDDPAIVWDEICGYLLTMFQAPPGLFAILLGFFFFRLFDIWKPWPIRLANDKIKGGFGIVVDDLLAAIYAWISLRIFFYLL